MREQVLSSSYLLPGLSFLARAADSESDADLDCEGAATSSKAGRRTRLFTLTLFAFAPTLLSVGALHEFSQKTGRLSLPTRRASSVMLGA